MELQILNTTDRKYRGFDCSYSEETKILTVTESATFVISRVINLGGGYWRFKNSNYILDCREA